jgi:hypothetical protein
VKAMEMITIKSLGTRRSKEERRKSNRFWLILYIIILVVSIPLVVYSFFIHIIPFLIFLAPILILIYFIVSVHKIQNEWLFILNYPKEIKLYENEFESYDNGAIKIPFTEVENFIFWDKEDNKNEFCIFLKDHRRFTLWISDENKNILLENLDKEKIVFPDEIEEKDTK